MKSYLLLLLKEEMITKLYTPYISKTNINNMLHPIMLLYSALDAQSTEYVNMPNNNFPH